jgi:hypothetical protein
MNDSSAILNRSTCCLSKGRPGASQLLIIHSTLPAPERLSCSKLFECGEFPTWRTLFSCFRAPESGALQRLRQVRCLKGREAFGVRCIPPLFIEETERTEVFQTLSEKVLASLRDALIRDFVPVVIPLMRRNDHRLPSTNPPGWGYRQSGGNRGNPCHSGGDFYSSGEVQNRLPQPIPPTESERSLNSTKSEMRPGRRHGQFFVGRSRDSSLDSAIALQP